MSKTSNIILCLIFIISCSIKENTDSEDNISNKSAFHQYIEETFNQKLINQPYIFIVGKRMCKLCELGVSTQFKEQQKRLNSKKILIITDLEPDDTLFIDIFKENIIVDSTSNFQNYNFPRSYITIYKINDGNIVDYSYFSDKTKLNKFLEQEHLLLEHKK